MTHQPCKNIEYGGLRGSRNRLNGQRSFTHFLRQVVQRLIRYYMGYVQNVSLQNQFYICRNVESILHVCRINSTYVKSILHRYVLYVCHVISNVPLHDLPERMCKRSSSVESISLLPNSVISDITWLVCHVESILHEIVSCRINST